MPEFNIEVLIVIDADSYGQARDAGDEFVLQLRRYAAEYNTDGNYGQVKAVTVEAIGDRRFK